MSTPPNSPYFHSEPWHLDKRVPLTLIVAMLAQTGAVFWWASGMESRMGSAASTIERQGQMIETLRDETQALALTAATVNVQLSGLSQALNEVKEAQRETNELLRALSAQGASP